LAARAGPLLPESDHLQSRQRLRGFGDKTPCYSGQLRYKAERAGGPLVWVDPRSASQQCPACRHAKRANRPTQALFRCVVCGRSPSGRARACAPSGYAGPADYFAPLNIGRRAVVIQPNMGAWGAAHGYRATCKLKSEVDDSI